MMKIKPNIQKILRRKLYIGLGIGVVVAAICISGIFTAISSEAADNLLRPILGEKGTLALESVFFGGEDGINYLYYTLFGQKAPAYASAMNVKSVKAQSVDQMTLKPLSITPGLDPMSSEGVWETMDQSLFPNHTILARTFIRPDKVRPYAVASLVEMDMKRLGVGTEAGTTYPGGSRGMHGPGTIPQQIQSADSLLAAFNGGFQEKDGHYGMIVGNKTYVPLRTDLPSLLLFKDGSVKFTDNVGKSLSPDVVAVRQNGPYLVHNGNVASFAEQGTDVWGRTITNSMYTWRSGLGITKEGNLIYAAGNSLVPATLASALQNAGAVDAIQLDINPPWVRFLIYTSKGQGQYSSSPLLTNMTGGDSFLHGYFKDLFYVYKK